MSDIRAALERLVELEDAKGPAPAIANAWTDAIAAARAALAAEPVGEGPSRVEAVAVYSEVMAARECKTLGEMAEHFARAILARWSHPVTPPAPLTDLAARLISESKPMDPEIAEALTPEARWDLYEGPAAPPAPEVGEVGELVEWLGVVSEQFRIAKLVYESELTDRAATLLQQFSAPAPAVVPVAVSDALIKAECALSDVAEGEPECDEGDPAQWAEQRCTETLAIIRPVMKLHRIRTSEWPPQPLPQVGEGEGPNA